MRLLIRQLWAIAALAALEAVRQPITALLSVSALAFVGLMPFLFTHTLGDADRLVRDSALALQFVLGLILGVLMASTALRAEMRGGTAAAVLSKPVFRPLFFIGKYLGLAAVMLTFSALMTMAAVLATRTVTYPFEYDLWGSGPLLAAVALSLAAGGVQNYFLRRPFASRAYGALLIAVPAAAILSGAFNDEGRWASWGSAMPLYIVPAGMLMALAILVLTAIALALATRFDVVPALVISSAVFMLGLMSDYLLGRRATDQPVAAFLDGIIPNFQHFWAADALAGDGVPWVYVARASLYAGAHLTAALAAGILAFRRAELRA